MRFSTDRSATASSPRHEQERERRQSLPYLIDRLGEIAPDVPDEDLRSDIHRWLGIATRLPADGRHHVENELESLNSEYPMYRERGRMNDECFPETCLNNCKHAEQQACPMLNDIDVIRRRRRIRSGNPTPEEYRQEMKALAGDVDCHVVAEAIRVVEEYHGPIIRYGQLLLAQAQEELTYADQSEELAQELASMSLEDIAEAADLEMPASVPDEVDTEAVDVESPADGDGDGVTSPDVVAPEGAGEADGEVLLDGGTTNTPNTRDTNTDAGGDRGADGHEPGREDDDREDSPRFEIEQPDDSDDLDEVGGDEEVPSS